MKKINPFSFFIFFMISCTKQELEIPEFTCNNPDITANKSVLDIFANAGSAPAPYLFDDVIEVYVVSSDSSNNFYKTISLQTIPTETTPAVGFSVPIDLSNYYVDFRLGNKVYIKMEKLYTDIYYGSFRVGGLYVDPNGKSSVGRISQADYKKIIISSCDFVSEDLLVKRGSIQDLLKDSNLNVLVEFTDVQFSREATGLRFYEEINNIGGGTNWILNDKTGSQLFFRTNSFADFSKKTVPSGKGKIRGVLTKFGTDYQLVARSENDIIMNQEREEPFFLENFQTVTDGTNLNLAGWFNWAQAGSLLWKGTLYSGNGYAEFSISGTKVDSNIGWLISPKIDMDSMDNEVLSFRSAQRNLSLDSPLNSLEVYISQDFDGLNVDTANWTKLNANFPTQATPAYQFVGSGQIDLSSYKGKINIGFKYTGSGKNTTLDGTFMIDDVAIYAQ